MKDLRNKKNWDKNLMFLELADVPNTYSLEIMYILIHIVRIISPKKNNVVTEKILLSLAKNLKQKINKFISLN